MRALIVEDHHASMLLYHKWLAEYFDSIDETSDGSKAVSLFLESLIEGKPYSFVLLDIMIHEINGYDVLREMRLLEKEYNSLPATIIIITASEKKEYIYESVSDLCDGYIEKPVFRDNLLSFLKKGG